VLFLSLAANVLDAVGAMMEFVCRRTAHSDARMMRMCMCMAPVLYLSIIMRPTMQNHSPVHVPDAAALQLAAADGDGRPEVAQQARRALRRDLPDPEEAQHVVYSVRMKIPAAITNAQAGQHRAATQQSAEF